MKCSIFFFENDFNSSNQSGFKPGWLLLISASLHQTRNLLTKVMRLEVFSLSSQKHLTKLARRYNFQINSKRNIMEFTQAFARFFKWEKTTRKSKWLSLNMDKFHCWNTSRFNSWSIIVFNLYNRSFRIIFLIYINDLSTNFNIFTSLSSVIHDSQTSANDLNKDLEMID